MSRVPVRLRLTLASTLAMAALLAGAGGFLYLRLSGDLSAALDRGLRQRALDVSATVGRPGVPLDHPDSPRLVEHGESFAQLLGTDGTVRQSSASLGGTPLLTAGEVRRAGHEVTLLDRRSVPGLDEPARLLATPVALRDGPAVLVVGGTAQNRVEALDSLRRQLLLGGPVLLTLAAAGAYLLTGAALRPIDDLLARLRAALARERDLVADASHELRTPLALLQTELGLALRRPRTAADLRAAVSSAAEETDRLCRLADDLLLVAQSDRGRLPVHLEPVDVVAALHRASREFARSAPGRIVVTGSAPVLAADPHRLGQALRNLLDNALRYGSGSVRLAVTENADTVEVHVTDEGSGFPAGYLAHAFERFTRADTGRSGRGAGLGLAIVDAVARAHGGTAHAANRAAGGADVWLVLPAGQDSRSRGTGGSVTRAGSTSRRSAQASNPATSTSYGGSSA